MASLPEKNSSFNAEQAEELIDALSQPIAAKTLMKRMVAYDPQDRPQAVSEVIREFEMMRQ